MSGWWQSFKVMYGFVHMGLGGKLSHHTYIVINKACFQDQVTENQLLMVHPTEVAPIAYGTSQGIGTNYLWYIPGNRHQLFGKPWKTIGHLFYTTLRFFCASFHSHWWIQTGVTVWKCLIQVKIGDYFCRVTFKFHRCPWKTIGNLF